SAGAAASFTAFFGGNWQDMLVSALLGVVLRFCMSGLEKVVSNNMFSNYVTAFIVGVLAIFSVKLGLGADYGKIIIGNIMLLISGAAFFNSLRDIITGDIMAGILRLCEAVVLAAFIAAGVVTAMIVTGVGV
ncbi:MAG: threonine/serine exporter family protein, partial [Oscillospiraceae bacterium]|nr:threonine/serine exporter family protein [Oscillospiraceae bacterium]